MNPRIYALGLILIAVLGLAGCDSALPSGPSSSTDAVRVTMVIKGLQPDVVDSFAVGQSVKVKDANALIGTIASVDSTLAVVPVGDSSGQLHVARSPVARDVRIVVEGDAVVSEAGFRFSGSYQYINNPTVFLTPYTQFLAIITHMEVTED